MKTSTLIASLTAASLLILHGCDRPTPKTEAAGLVAVVDMARLQQETGFTKNRTAELNKLQGQFQASFTSLQMELNASLDKEVQAMRKFPTPQQQARVEQERARASQVLEDRYAEMQAQMQQRDMELQTSFRAKVHDSVAAAAAERGMSVVLETGPWMVAASDECNVTSAALAKIKAANINFDTTGAAIPGSPGIPGLPGAAPGTTARPSPGPSAAPMPLYQPSGPSYPGAPMQKPNAPSTAPGAAPVPATAPATQPQ